MGTRNELTYRNVQQTAVLILLLTLCEMNDICHEPKIRKPATLWESPAALHSTQSAMGLLHTVTATYLIIASEASRCVIDCGLKMLNIESRRRFGYGCVNDLLVIYGSNYCS